MKIYYKPSELKPMFGIKTDNWMVRKMRNKGVPLTGTKLHKDNLDIFITKML